MLGPEPVHHFPMWKHDSTKHSYDSDFSGASSILLEIALVLALRPVKSDKSDKQSQADILQSKADTDMKVCVTRSRDLPAADSICNCLHISANIIFTLLIKSVQT